MKTAAQPGLQKYRIKTVARGSPRFTNKGWTRPLSWRGQNAGQLLQDINRRFRKTRSSPVRLQPGGRAVTPYVNRLFDLGLLGLWAVDAPNVFRWFSAIRERANFAPAISVYLTDADRALFANVDPETPGRVKDILDWD